MLGEKSDHPDLKLLFPDTAVEEKSWFAKHHVLPINHMVVVKQELSEQSPDAVREVHRLLLEAAKGTQSSFPGHDIRRSLTMIINYAVQQGLIPRAFTVDELFDDVTRPLLERMPQR